MAEDQIENVDTRRDAFNLRLAHEVLKMLVQSMNWCYSCSGEPTRKKPPPGCLSRPIAIPPVSFLFHYEARDIFRSVSAFWQSRLLRLRWPEKILGCSIVHLIYLWGHVSSHSFEFRLRRDVSLIPGTPVFTRFWKQFFFLHMLFWIVQQTR